MSEDNGYLQEVTLSRDNNEGKTHHAMNSQTLVQNIMCVRKVVAVVLGCFDIEVPISFAYNNIMNRTS